MSENILTENSKFDTNQRRSEAAPVSRTLLQSDVHHDSKNNKQKKQQFDITAPSKALGVFREILIEHFIVLIDINYLNREQKGEISAPEE